MEANKADQNNNNKASYEPDSTPLTPPTASHSTTNPISTSITGTRTGAGCGVWRKIEARLRFLRILFVLGVVYNTVFVAMFLFILPFLLFDFLTAVVILLAAAAIYSPTYWGNPASTGRRTWPAFKRGFVIQDLISWFQGDVVKTSDLPAGKQYIFAFAPHGILPFTASWLVCHNKWEKLFPSIDMVTLGSSAFHYAPIIRDLAMWSGTRHIDQHCFELTLKQGNSVLLIPGGIAELRLSRSTSRVIELNGRHQGFVRIALSHGIPIVPVFSFGETLPFDTVHIPLLTWLSFKVFRIPFPYFTGMGGIWQFPRKTRITVVVGPPIHVDKEENPTAHQVWLLHRKFYKELHRLFEDHKHRHGHGDYSLKILKDSPHDKEKLQ